MQSMQSKSIVRRTRTTLFAGVSVVALMVSSPAVRAADLPTKAPPIVSAPVTKNTWTWWVEGGAFNTSDPAFGGFPPVTSPVGIQPNIGPEGAIGFDYSPASFAPYHYSGQFRYGYAQRSKSFPARYVNTAFHFSTTTTTANVAGAGTAKLKEHHWLVDFAVGRDFQLGAGQTQAKIGIRVADIYAKVTGNGVVSGSTSVLAVGSPIAGVFSFASRSRFLGVGPRVGIDGGIPLGGAWSLDYLGGVAVLFGDRKFDSNSAMTLTITSRPTTGTLSTAASSSSTGAVFNLDAQAGISYHFNPNFSMMLSYRFDGYWNALRTINTAAAIVDENVFYYGPMLRASVSF